MAETHAFQLDHVVRGRLDYAILVALGNGERHVGHALGVYAQHFELDALLDQRSHAGDELLFIRDKREQHPDREPAIEHE